MTEKPAKPSTKRATSRKPKTKPRKPDHREISERAYFIHLEGAGAMSSAIGYVRSAN